MIQCNDLVSEDYLCCNDSHHYAQDASQTLDLYHNSFLQNFQRWSTLYAFNQKRKKKSFNWQIHAKLSSNLILPVLHWFLSLELFINSLKQFILKLCLQKKPTSLINTFFLCFFLELSVITLLNEPKVIQVMFLPYLSYSIKERSG